MKLEVHQSLVYNDYDIKSFTIYILAVKVLTIYHFNKGG